MTEEYHVVSFSGGKDSTAMLLHMIELNMRIDEIIFCDTGVEFPQMYEHVDKVERYIGRKITRLKSEKSFEYYLIHHKRTRGKHMDDIGWGWPGPLRRWCTKHLKTVLVSEHLRELSKKYAIVQYIGIAADETKRIKDKNYPLVDWNWTEADALQYCYEKGFDWGGLYKLFSRVSCWCCPLQPLSGLRNLRRHFPELWAQLGEWEKKVNYNTFRADYSVQDLEAKFAREDEIKAMQISLFDEVTTA